MPCCMYELRWMHERKEKTKTVPNFKVNWGLRWYLMNILSLAKQYEIKQINMYPPSSIIAIAIHISIMQSLEKI
jgi:hypothetical protein